MLPSSGRIKKNVEMLPSGGRLEKQSNVSFHKLFKMQALLHRLLTEHFTFLLFIVFCVLYHFLKLNK